MSEHEIKTRYGFIDENFYIDSFGGDYGTMVDRYIFLKKLGETNPEEPISGEWFAIRMIFKESEDGSVQEYPEEIEYLEPWINHLQVSKEENSDQVKIDMSHVYTDQEAREIFDYFGQEDKEQEVEESIENFYVRALNQEKESD